MNAPENVAAPNTGHGQAPQDDPVQTAIAALTALAREQKTIGAGTPFERQEPADFADLLASIIASVAANLGGAEELLAGRSGSWEAGLVRQLVEGTASDEPGELLRWRTEPIDVSYFADSRVELLSFQGNDDLEAETLSAELSKLYDERDQYATDAERQQLHEAVAEHEAAFQARIPGAPRTAEEDAAYDRMTERVGVHMREYSATVHSRAEVAGDPLVHAIAAKEREIDAIEQRAEADRAVYVEAFQTALRAKLAELGVEAPVVIDDRGNQFTRPLPGPVLEELIEDAHSTAAAAVYTRRAAAAESAAR